MITLLDAMAVTAATYFLVMLLAYTKGPFDLFERFRTWLGIEKVYDTEGHVVDTIANGFWAKVFDCHRCLTPYVSVPVAVLWFFFPYAVYFLGVMGAAMWMAETSKT